MGYKFDSSGCKCPLFQTVIKTTKGQFIGIECLTSDLNLGFDISHVIRVRNSIDLRDYMEIFCKDMYTTCPCYRQYCRECGIDV